RRFDSSMGIQVTALLSAIALYLALPKVDTEQATLSDKIFMLTYAAVSIMIGLSIVKDNLASRDDTSILAMSVTGLQRVIFPLAVPLVIGWLLMQREAMTPSALMAFVRDRAMGLIGM
ncbi:MAG: hypothetical protein AAFY64_00065, partial [Pseudomonadota bacterium]